MILYDNTAACHLNKKGITCQGKEDFVLIVEFRFPFCICLFLRFAFHDILHKGFIILFNHVGLQAFLTAVFLIERFQPWLCAKI